MPDASSSVVSMRLNRTFMELKLRRFERVTEVDVS